MSSPTIIIKRLKVEGFLGCDIQFSPGLNVVKAVPKDADPRSSNSCGKSTLVELIRYGLGRRYDSRDEFHEIVQLRGKVRKLWLEAQLSGKNIVTERSLESVTGLMSVRWSTLDNAKNITPLRMTPPDFSEVALDALSIPSVSVARSDGTSENLSFPALQRAFILHQEDSFFSILDKVQPSSRKTQIIGFLSGITAQEAFALEPLVAQLKQRSLLLETKIANIDSFLSEHGVNTPIEAISRIEAMRIRLAEAQEHRYQIQYQMKNASEKSSESDGKIRKLREKYLQDQEAQQKIEQDIEQINAQVEQLYALKGSLLSEQKKWRRERVSSELFSSVKFEKCPRCLQQITSEMRKREETSRCCLCSRPVSLTSDSIPQHTPTQNELEDQIGEIGNIVQSIEEKRNSLVTQNKEYHTSLKITTNELDIETRAFVAPLVDKLAAQTDTIVSLSNELAILEQLGKQVESLESLRSEFSTVSLELKRALLKLEELRTASSKILEELRLEFQRVLKSVKWPAFNYCDIDSETLFPLINGVSYQTEGTGMKALAIVCYHLALFQLSRRRSTYFPSLLVIDSPAIGDLNELNHDALLEYLATRSSNVDESTSWQIILTTRRMVPSLEPYVKVTVRTPDMMLLSEQPPDN